MWTGQVVTTYTNYTHIYTYICLPRRYALCVGHMYPYLPYVQDGCWEAIVSADGVHGWHFPSPHSPTWIFLLLAPLALLVCLSVSVCLSVCLLRGALARGRLPMMMTIMALCDMRRGSIAKRNRLLHLSSSGSDFFSSYMDSANFFFGLHTCLH